MKASSIKTKLLIITIITMLIIVICLAAQTTAQIAGGVSPLKVVLSEEEMKEFYTSVSPLFRQHLKEMGVLGGNVNITHTAPYPIVIGVRTQVVAGLNLDYFVQFVGNSWRVKVFRGLDGSYSLVGVEKV